MNRLKRLLVNRGNKNRTIKKDQGSISHFERRNRMFNNRSREFDQFVKLFFLIISYTLRKKHSESILYKEGD